VNNVDSISPETSSNLEQVGKDTSMSWIGHAGGTWSRMGHSSRCSYWNETEIWCRRMVMINGVSIKKDEDDNAKPKLQLPEKLSESRMVPHQSGLVDAFIVDACS